MWHQLWQLEQGLKDYLRDGLALKLAVRLIKGIQLGAQLGLKAKHSSCVVWAFSHGEEVQGPVTQVRLVHLSPPNNFLMSVFHYIYILRFFYFTIICICEYLSVGLDT